MSSETLTLAYAIELHLRAMRAKRCSPRSLESVSEESARHLGDWLERPIASISRNECALRHEHISDHSGPHVANRVMRQFRAVYNTAARRFEHIPQTNPVIAVTFNRVRRRREPIVWEELPAWHRKVAAMANPVRRDLQLFLLFTGLRSLDARTVRFEHVDFEHVTLHRPKPKGGEDRAFTVPIAARVLDLIVQRQTQNLKLLQDDGGWVFPSRSREGLVTYVRDAKERKRQGGRWVKQLPSPHRLRDTFATAAHEAEVHPLDLKVLMNHSLPSMGDVTAGYIRPSIGHLRASVERVAEFLKRRMASPESPSGAPQPGC
jgi:integrase